MRETKIYEKLRPHLNLWGECDRVENSIGSGMSDIYYNIGGKTGWIETKVAKGNMVCFEKFQRPWIRKHHKQGARIFVVVVDKDERMHFYPAGIILAAPSFAYEKWVAVDMTMMPRVFNMEPPYRSWKSVRDLLTS